MKAVKLAALLGATASALSPLVGRDDAPQEVNVESVVLVTSTFTVTECATDAVNCPPTAIIVSTSTTVVSTTTTICSTTSVPVVGPSDSLGVTSAASATPSLPLGPGPVVPSTTMSRIPSTLALPTMPDTPNVTSKSPVSSDKTFVSLIPGSSISASDIPRPSGSDVISVSIIIGSTIESTISIVPPTPSVSGGSSYGAPSESVISPSAVFPSGLSSSSGRSSVTDAIPSSGVSSGPHESSRPSGSSPGPVNTNTDATATSFPVASSMPSPYISQTRSAPSYSSGYGASSRASMTAPTSVSAPPTSNTSTVSSPLPYPSSTPNSQPAVSSASSSSSSVNTTVLVTTRITQTHTSYITLPASTTGPNSNTETDATWSLRPSSMTGVPSGTGYPSYSSNGTVISPKPTYSEVPINAGNVIGAGEHSYAALVIALAFLFFA